MPTTSTGRSSGPGPVLVSDRLILVSSDGYADLGLALYGRSCWAGWKFPTAPIIAPVVANGTLYLLTNDAQLVALR